MASADTEYRMPFVSSLLFRSGPSRNSQALRALGKYEVLEFVREGGEEVIDGMRGRWIEIRTDKGERGFCFDGYCVEADPSSKGEPDYQVIPRKAVIGSWDRDFPATEIPNWRMTFARDGGFYEGGWKTELTGRWTIDESGRRIGVSRKDGRDESMEIVRIDRGYLTLQFDGEALAFARRSTELNRAAADGNLAKVEFLLDHGYDPNTLEWNSISALFYAVGLDVPVSAEKLAIIRLLLERGARAAQDDMYGSQPMNYVRGCLKEKTVLLLLAKGADIDHGKEASLLATVAFGSNENPDWKFIEFLISRGADLTCQRHPGWGSALVSLVDRYSDRIPDLLRLAGNPDLSEDGDLLSQAVWFERYDLVRFLLVRMKPDAPDKRSSAWRSPTALLTAASRQNAGMAKLLLEAGADPDIPNGGGDTPLHIVSVREGGFIQGADPAGFIRLLARYGAKLDAKNARGWTALHSAAAKMETDSVEALLAAGAGVNEADSDGDTPLHLLLKRLGKEDGSRALDSVRFLLSKGASIELKNSTGQTAADIALRNGNAALAALVGK
jgi:uncharacterized protein